MSPDGGIALFRSKRHTNCALLSNSGPVTGKQNANLLFEPHLYRRIRTPGGKINQAKLLKVTREESASGP